MQKQILKTVWKLTVIASHGLLLPGGEDTTKAVEFDILNVNSEAYGGEVQWNLPLEVKSMSIDLSTDLRRIRAFPFDSYSTSPRNGNRHF